MFPKYSEYFGDRFSEIFQSFPEMLSSKYPGYFGKIVWNAIIEISGIFREKWFVLLTKPLYLPDKESGHISAYP